MYRDDVCAVCGESLPPDHFYCREHAAGVDDRLHEIGTIVPRLLGDLGRLTELLSAVAEETWDYLAESEPDDPVWPPVPSIHLRADADEVDVDVDSEPGYVAVRLELALVQLLTALHEGIDTPELRRAAAACAVAEGANSTHER
jgi:hypothetical protein